MTFLKSGVTIFAMLFFCSFLSRLSDWYKFDDNYCSILFPETPKNDTLTKESSVGKIKFYRHVVKNEQTEKDSTIAYELLATEYPETETELIKPTKEIAESLFTGAISSSIKQVNGKLVSQKDIANGSYFGKEAKISFDNNSKLLKMQCYLIKTRLYFVETVALSEKENNKHSTTFFESFKIK